MRTEAKPMAGSNTKGDHEVSAQGKNKRAAIVWDAQGGLTDNSSGVHLSGGSGEPDYAAAYKTDTGPGAVYSWTQLANGDLISDWKNAQEFELYAGNVIFADSVLASGKGFVKTIGVKIVNTSSEAWSVKFTVRCGDWSQTDHVEWVEPNSTLQGPATLKELRYTSSGSSYYGYRL